MLKRIASEIKEEILIKIRSGGKVADLASQYGISDKTIYNWLARMVTPEVSFSEYNRLRRENDELKRMIGIISLDLNLEKKRKIIVYPINETIS
jgi:transposase-like protein